jgi:hypothetical protein
MTAQHCSVCGATLNIDWINIQTVSDPEPVYIPGQRECPNRCDPKVARLLTREDGPVWDSTGKCVSLGLAEEITTITGDPNATLTTVMNDPDLTRRRETLYRIRITADRLDAIQAGRP